MDFSIISLQRNAFCLALDKAMVSEINQTQNRAAGVVHSRRLSSILIFSIFGIKRFSFVAEEYFGISVSILTKIFGLIKAKVIFFMTA